MKKVAASRLVKTPELNQVAKNMEKRVNEWAKRTGALKKK